ncbi:hypothetical protein E2C01_007145 [Portunus trituberculatus]|uniref:GIY-YIG domain-containing protein n=1 Tax=Portunus trituberculatus TaxID=210409 RepID=A0A5B7CZQ1_PORTR|nr:hypothetical protein [Portunus trituberculatus]
MSTAHKEDEKVLKNVIHKNVKPTNPDTKLDIVIYYKSRKTANLVMKNSCLPATSPLQAVNVLYQHTDTDCSRLNTRYIGVTTTTLSRRIRAHLTDGAIRKYYNSEHGLILKRKHMEDKTPILTTDNNIKRLKMTEAVLIYTLKPSINIQQQPDTSLPSKRHRLQNNSLIG